MTEFNLVQRNTTRTRLNSRSRFDLDLDLQGGPKNGTKFMAP